MIAALVFASLVAQEPTVTFTHRCSRAEVVIAALGKELGQDLQVSGSVKDDYFLVRFDKTPVSKALDRIAKTLNATWTRGRDTTFLTRTAGQESAEQKEEQAKIETAISKYAQQHRIPELPGKDELTRILKASAEAHERGIVDDENVRLAASLNPDNIFHNAYFQMLDRRALAALTVDGFYFMSLRPHDGLVTVPTAGIDQLRSIARFAATHDDILDTLGFQTGRASQQQTLVNRDLMSADEVLFGAVRDEFTLELVTYHAKDRSATTSSGRFIDLLGTGEVSSDIPGAKGTFNMSFDRQVAEVFARPRSTEPTPETSSRLYDALLKCQTEDPLSWLASEPILQAAESEGWDVVAVLPDPMGWDAWWMPSAPGQSLGSVLKQELAGWSKVEFDKEAKYLSVRPLMAAAFRRSRVDRAQVVKTVEAVKARKSYLLELAKLYSWETQKEERSALFRLLASSIGGLKNHDLDRDFESSAMILLASLSSAQIELARRDSGFAITASQAPRTLRDAIRRVIGKCATESVRPKFEDGKPVGLPQPAIIALLTSDPDQTTIHCRMIAIDDTEAVLFQFEFPSGGTLMLSAEFKLPKPN